ncbi:DDE-type integrase/transposase/recombinase [Paenibacillus sp. CC-CFT747]|nr:DDE-type integrase/transposase/recombinase [Paenibacillus sp. CC-CFT747]
MADSVDFRIANQRMEVLQKVASGESVAIPMRTVRDWTKRFKEAEMIYGEGYVGLLPKHKQKGNRNSRLEQEIKNLMKDHIENDYLNIKQKRIAVSYGAFADQCEKKGYYPVPSYKAFSTTIQEVDIERRMRKREGKRAAYPFRVPYLYLEYTTPRHGDRVFQIAHIDHTQLDIVLVDSKTGKELGKPWVTYMTDAFNRRILALYLTFDPPSYRSCMMVIRECVKRHSKIPDVLVVDGGKDFQSVYFDTLLAMYGKTKKVRPPGQPKYGSVAERLFGKTNTQVIHALIGNTQSTKKPRQMTKEVDPKKHATWTFESFHKQLCKYAYEVHDELYHPALGMNPREAYEQSIQLSGNREYRLIAYNEDFIILTLPSTRKGTAMVHPVNGVKMNNFYYNNTQLKNAKLARKQVPVRYDPFDMGVAYVYAHNRWVKCFSQYYSTLKGRTEKEIEMITTEIKARNKQNHKHFTVNAKMVARFIQEAEADHSVSVQRQKDLERHSAYTISDVDDTDEEMFFDEDLIDNMYEDSTEEFEGYGEL